MSELVDDLSRRLAQPMPRSRALRTTARSSRHRLALGAVGLAVLATGGVSVETAVGRSEGRPPTPSRDRALYFQGRFSDPRWGGAIGIAIESDGRSLMSIAGIAPGVCDDEDFGRLVAGRDGATGPRFAVFASTRIRDDGGFAVSERKAGQRRPFKPASDVSVKGTFSGDVVRGTLRAKVETPFDRCTADVAFTARRIG